jgi:hypothetical protein
MDIVRLRIPYVFIRERCHMSWREIRFGLVNELLDPAAAIELAVDQVAGLEQPSAAVLELAGANRNEPTLGFVERLAGGEHEGDEDAIRGKWLYLVLAWLYEHRDEDSDPLQRVEEVYADFGYPEEIAGLVRYMPMDGPDMGSRKANEQRLVHRWAQYLKEAARVHGL